MTAYQRCDTQQKTAFFGQSNRFLFNETQDINKPYIYGHIRHHKANILILFRKVPSIYVRISITPVGNDRTNQNIKEVDPIESLLVFHFTQDKDGNWKFDGSNTDNRMAITAFLGVHLDMPTDGDFVDDTAQSE